MPLSDSALAGGALAIQSESLQQLLTAIRCEHVAAKTQDGPLSLKPGQVIEIQGASGSGKTHLVYHLVLESILSSSSNVAVIFDTSHTFDIQRLDVLIHTRRGDSVNARLDRILVFHPENTVQLCATLAHLPALLAKRYPDGVIGLVAIDSMSEFFWQDKFVDEMRASLPQKQPQRQQSTMGHAFSALEKLRRSFGPSIVLTNWGLVRTLPTNAVPPGSQHRYFKSHLDHYYDHTRPATTTTPQATFVSAIQTPRLPLHYHVTLTHGQDSMFDARVYGPNNNEVENSFRMRVTENDVVVRQSSQSTGDNPPA